MGSHRRLLSLAVSSVAGVTLAQAPIEMPHRMTAATPLDHLRTRVGEPLARWTRPSETISAVDPAVNDDHQDAGVISTATRIQQDRAEAQQRMKAVQYLATVDCHSWPEAEDALIRCLRGDRNEWVRHQAALVLGRGPCSTKKTVKALEQSASADDSDGFPRERSARVRAAAQIALERSLQSFVDLESHPHIIRTGYDAATAPQPMPQAGSSPAEPKPQPDAAPRLLPARERSATPPQNPETMPASSTGKMDPKIFYAFVNDRPTAEILADARRVLQELGPRNSLEPSLSNPLDLQAAGLPIAVDARTHSPRPATLLEALTRREPVVTAATVAPAPVRTTVVTMTVSAMPPTAGPRPTSSPSPSGTLVSGGVVPSSALSSASLPTTKPSAVGTALSSTGAPGAVSVRPAQASTIVSKPTNPTPAVEAASQWTKLTEADFRKNPTLASETAQQAKRSSDPAVRLACLQALVRGRAFSPTVLEVLRDLTADPSPEVRAEADLGLALAEILKP